MMHFDEQSFIRNLLTNDRVLHYNQNNSFQSHDTLPGNQIASIAGQQSAASMATRDREELSNRGLNNFQTTGSHQAINY